MTSTPTYLKDTQDLIKKIEDVPFPSDAVLLTLDVTALYTNITHAEVYRAIAHFLDQRIDPFPPTHFLLEILDLVLEKNYFKFIDKFFIQIKGIAMGSAMAPSVANLFMSTFEKEHILDASNPFLSEILIFKRYIDDLLFVYANKDTVEEFIKWLNLISFGGWCPDFSRASAVYVFSPTGYHGPC